jgi:hypothetical protein
MDIKEGGYARVRTVFTKKANQIPTDGSKALE